MAKYKPYRYWIYLLARIVAALLCVLPRRVVLAVARSLGILSYSVLIHHRQNTLDHLRLAFPQKTEQERRSIARKVFGHLAQTGAEVLLFPKLNLVKVEAFTETGQAYRVYEQLLKEGKGLISLTSHIGNWELLAGIIALKGFRGQVVARQLRYFPFQKWIESLRRSIQLETIYRDESPKKMFQLLAKNEILGVLPDQDIDSVKGVFVDFFGRPAYTTVAPVKLALATGAPILTNFMIRLPKDRYRIVIGDVIRPVIRTTKEAAIFEFTQQWMKSSEAVIRQYPDQWGWLHNRWKTRVPSSWSGSNTGEY